MSTPHPIRILHFSSSARDADCGIGKYQEHYLAGMRELLHVDNVFFAVSPYQTRAMSPAELQDTLRRLRHELRNFDILHIQHEFGLYWFDQFKQIVETAKAAQKKVVVTVHLSPDYAIKPAVRGGLGPRSWLTYLRARNHYERMLIEHIEPLRRVDVVLVHNQVTAESLQRFGVDPLRIIKLPHPVYVMDKPKLSTRIGKVLHKKDGDILYCITGFLHRYKGILGAVRALKFLPSNYKLVLLGGIKGDSDDVAFEDKVTDLIDQLGLHDRVYITGFVKDDDELNAYIRECDISIYPYDRVYYSNVSSGSLNLAFTNDQPVIAYPTSTLKELAADADGAVVLTETFAYYELARELLRIDIPAQRKLSHAYAAKMAWPKMAKDLAEIYQRVVRG